MQQPSAKERGDVMNLDILAMQNAIDDLRAKSVSVNSDGNAPCTVNDLQKLRNSIADTLQVIVDSLNV